MSTEGRTRVRREFLNELLDEDAPSVDIGETNPNATNERDVITEEVRNQDPDEKMDQPQTAGDTQEEVEEEKKAETTDLSAADIMSKLQTGIGSFFTSAAEMAQPANFEQTSVKVKQAFGQGLEAAKSGLSSGLDTATAMTNESLGYAKEGFEYASSKTKDGLEYASTKTKDGLDFASEVTKDGYSYAKDKTVAGTGAILVGAASASTVVKGKLDETGVTDTAKQAGSYVYETGASGVSYVNEKIEANPTLASAKTAAAQTATVAATAAAETASKAASYLSGFFWGSKPVQEEPQEENKESGVEEEKKESDEGFSETV